MLPSWVGFLVIVPLILVGLALPFLLLSLYPLREEPSIDLDSEIHEILYGFRLIILGDLVFNIFLKSLIKTVFKGLYIPSYLDYIVLELQVIVSSSVDFSPY